MHVAESRCAILASDQIGALLSHHGFLGGLVRTELVGGDRDGLSREKEDPSERKRVLQHDVLGVS